MSNQLKLQVVLETMDRLSTPLRNMNKRIKKHSDALKDAKSQLTSLNKKQKVLDGAKKLRHSTMQSKQAYAEAHKEVKALARQMAAAENPSDNLRKSYDKALKKTKTLNKNYNKQNDRLRLLKREMRATGINTKDLGSYQKKLSTDISATNRTIDKHRKKLGMLNQAHRGFNKFKSIAGKVGKIGLYAGTAGIAAGSIFGGSLLNTAAEFERYETILKTVEGTSSKAAKSMDWVSNFAAKTPYELSEVTDSFVKMRAYGLDPTSGLLETLGDTASAMGKPMMQAVEAIADAVTGENERLKEFGIKAGTKGNEITYNYTDKDGIQRFKKVMKSDRKAIETALSDIWREKYGGAMEEQSKTWSGMMSNLRDQWMRFKLLVMRSGAFDSLKDKLNSILDTLNKMADSGELKAFAEKIGHGITLAIEKVSAFFKGAYQVFVKIREMTDTVGGMGNALKLFAGASAGLKVAGILELGKGLGLIIKSKGAIAVMAKMGTVIKLFGMALLATPIGWFAMAVGALAGAAYWLYTNWATVTDFFQNNAFAKAMQDLPVVRDLIAGVSSTIEVVAALLQGDWATAWSAAKSVAKSAIKIATVPVRTLWKLIKKLGDYIGIDFGAAFQKFKDLVIPIIDAVAAPFRELLGIIQNAINAVRELGGISGTFEKMTGQDENTPSFYDFAKDTIGGVFGREPTYGGHVPKVSAEKVSSNVTNTKNISAPITQHITINEASNPRAVANAIAKKTGDALIGDN